MPRKLALSFDDAAFIDGCKSFIASIPHTEITETETRMVLHQFLAGREGRQLVDRCVRVELIEESN